MYSELVERVAYMLEDAVRYAEEKLGNMNAVDLLKENHADALGYFRYFLAVQIGNYLGEVSEHVLEVYAYPETFDEETTITLPLTLIVRMGKYTAALESIVEALQKALLDEYRKMFSPITDNLLLYLIIYFVDEDDFLKRKGLAAAVKSLHAPALLVWSR